MEYTTKVEQKIIHQDIELAQDSYWTRNPGDPEGGQLGPDSPKSVWIEGYVLTETTWDDGEIVYTVDVHHDWNGWEIYSDTGFEKAINEMIEGYDVHWSEQGLQQYGIGNFDAVKKIEEIA